MDTNQLADFKILEIVNIRRENMRLKTECKDCHVLSCRISGESMFFYKGNIYPVRQGDVLYIPRGASYCQTCQSEQIIAIHLDVIGNAPDDIRIFRPGDPEEMCRLFQSIAHSRQENAHYQCLSDLYRILAISNIVDAPREADYGCIAPSVRYLQAHLYDTDLSLDTVYRQSAVSQTCFIKHFRQHFGCTPVKYVNGQRIQKAKHLLRSRLYTREEIATLCGFENVKHFYVVFKKIAGCTTGEYLKNSGK